MKTDNLELVKGIKEIKPNVKRLIKQQEEKNKNVLLLNAPKVNDEHYEKVRKKTYEKDCVNCKFRDSRTNVCNKHHDYIYDTKLYAFTCDDMEEIDR